MFKKKRSSRNSEIINWYYNSVEGSEADERIKNKFFLWMASDHDSDEKDEILKKLYAAERGNSDDLAGRRAVDMILTRIENSDGFSAEPKLRAVRKPIKLIAKVAAVLIPLFMLAGGWLLFENSRSSVNAEGQITVISVPNAQRDEVNLSDGTKITVNAGSRITYPKDIENEKQRVVELVGESYFEVAKNKQKPFVVKTKDLIVTVLGTEFNVEAYPERDVTIVTLSKGKVNVTTPDYSTYTLEPSQQLIFTHSTRKAEIVNLKQEIITDSSDWRNGALVFSDYTLLEVLKSLERKFDIKVEASDLTSIGDRLISAKFDSDQQLDQVMEVLNTIIPDFRYEIQSDKLLIAPANKRN